MSRVPREIVVSVDQVDDVLFETYDGRMMRAVRWNLTDEGTAAVRQGYVCLLCLGDLNERFADCDICTPCHGYSPGKDQAALYASLYLGEHENPDDAFLDGVDRDEFERTAGAVRELNDAFGKRFEERREELGEMTFDAQADRLERASWRRTSGIWVPGSAA